VGSGFKGCPFSRSFLGFFLAVSLKKTGKERFFFVFVFLRCLAFSRVSQSLTFESMSATTTTPHDDEEEEEDEDEEEEDKWKMILNNPTREFQEDMNATAEVFHVGNQPESGYFLYEDGSVSKWEYDLKWDDRGCFKRLHTMTITALPLVDLEFNKERTYVSEVVRIIGRVPAVRTIPTWNNRIT
jgi:hypothetical protein